MNYYDLPDELQDSYEWLDDESKVYPLEWKDKVLRFKRNMCVDYCMKTVDLNSMWREARKAGWPKKDLQLFYRQMGYSLSGYGDIQGWDDLP